MADVIWTSPAFLLLETLPDKTALELFRRAEMLRAFPKMGAAISGTRTVYSRYRQLICRKKYRIIYEIDEFDGNAYILIVQYCKQKLPDPRQLKRQMPNEN